MSAKAIATMFAASCAAGSLVGQAPAAAQPLIPLPLAPPCNQWALNFSSLHVNVDNGVKIVVPWDTNAKVFAAPANADLTWPGGHWTGPADGSILPSPQIHMNFTWDISDQPGSLMHSKADGIINQDGLASGTYVDQVGASYNWSSPDKFFCRDAAPSPGGLDVGASAEVGGNKVADLPGAAPAPPEPEKPPTDAIAVKFGPPKLGSITATVTNSSKLLANCHYTAEPFGTERDFTVPANGSSDQKFSGLNLGATYRTVTECTADFNGTPTVIGRVEQDVTF